MKRFLLWMCPRCFTPEMVNFDELKELGRDQGEKLDKIISTIEGIVIPPVDENPTGMMVRDHVARRRKRR